MTGGHRSVPRRILAVCAVLAVLLLAAVVLGLASGAAGGGLKLVWQSLFTPDQAPPVASSILWRIRLPRVLMAVLLGGALSLGGLVFQALLRNPLAEPYILGISGGAAVGAIIGILLGLARFPGVTLTAFAGSSAVLALLLVLSTGRSMLAKDALLLSGVMLNALCSAVIMMLIYMTHDSRLHNVMFWLMGDLSLVDLAQVGLLAVVLLPCVAVLLGLSNGMNLLLMGTDLAQSMGLDTRRVSLTLLVVTSVMVSATVSQCGPVGFVGLVMPHLLRLIMGSDHRVLVPACLLGGGAYMVICDLMARVLPRQGEMPAGVVTAMIGAPLFIYLLKRAR